METVEAEKVACVWFNGTLGLISYWVNSNRTQSGRGRTTVSAIPQIPILDVSRLSDNQTLAAVQIYDDLCQKPLLPTNEAYRDPVRQELDRRLLTEVLRPGRQCRRATGNPAPPVVPRTHGHRNQNHRAGQLGLVSRAQRRLTGVRLPRHRRGSGSSLARQPSVGPTAVLVQGWRVYVEHLDVVGELPLRFGPLNQAGGERRLNVAVTRARSQVHLVSCFSHHDIDPRKSSARGVELLRLYLEFTASSGTEIGSSLSNVPLNGFELDVRDRLTEKGIPITPQYGVSGFRIDFACAHPDQPGRMVLAIEADGASYHSAHTARDRDRLRQQVLEDKGWRFHRI